MQAWRFVLSRLGRRLWVRAALYGALGVATALLAALFSPLVPDALAKPFGGGTVDALLNVLATSLLAVATFSTAAMLTAYTNVSQGATPRAAALITGDSQAQGALATFVGAFLYAVVAFSALGTGYYAGGGRAILFGVTLVVLAVVAVTLLRWLDQLLDLARVGHAIDRVEAATRKAMGGPFGAQCGGGLRTAPPDDAAPVRAGAVGYVQNVDLAALEALAEKQGLEVWVLAPPGAFADPGRVIARVAGSAAPQTLAQVRDAFVVGDARSFDQDPRFGMIVLGEIASRALSPGINDPGTAIDVTGTAVRLLSEWIDLERAGEPGPTGRVRLTRPTLGELADDVFTPLSRDGASTLSVAVRLQKALAALRPLASPGDRPALETLAEHALARSEAALDFEPDRKRVREAAAP